MLVMKFGGSSVANREQIEKVRAIVAERRARRPLVVVSAHRGITNALVAAGKAAAAGEGDAGRDVVERQRAIAAECGTPKEVLEPFFEELGDLLRGVRLVRELSPRSLDYISSFGERMSVRVIADWFERRGLPCRAFDVWELGFVTDSRFGAARPLPGLDSRVRAALAQKVPEGVVPVVTGFVGKNEAGEITTVGRNGSDLTATLLAAAVGAEEVEIWSDTDGVMTADPHLVPSARNIPRMSFAEASELAYFGSRVLHPETLLPAMGRDIPVRVLNTNRPEHQGTVITREPGGRSGGPITSIAYKERQVLLTVRSERMFAESGFLSRLFEATTRHGVVVDVVATSEVSVSLSAAEEGPLRRVADDLAPLGDCRIVAGKAILCVVGHHLPETPGAAARILQAVASAGVNVELLSYAMGSINVTMVIDDREVDRAVRTLHATLFEG